MSRNKPWMKGSVYNPKRPFGIPLWEGAFDDEYTEDPEEVMG